MKQKFLQTILFVFIFFLSGKIFAAGCTADYTYISSDPTVYFTDASSGSLVSMFWDFGDGTYSTDPDPVHTYAVNGEYNVCLSVYGLDGGDSCYDMTCKTIEIELAAPAECNADFSYAVYASGVLFANTSYAGGSATYEYNWDFGDGTYSSEENPLHVFPGEGIYTVCLVIITPDCLDSACMEVYFIDSTGSGSCSASFTYSLSDFSAAFENTSYDGGASSADYFWDFGDGTYATTDDASHVFTPGVYSVCLSIYTSDSCVDTYCQILYITDSIPPVDSSCSAIFSYEIISAGDYAFDNGSTGAGLLAYGWDFGDGTYSSEENPEHTYDSTGNYLVCLTVLTMDSCVSTYCDSVSYFTPIEELPSLQNASVFPNPVNGTLHIAFTNYVNGNVDIYLTDLLGEKSSLLFSREMQTGDNIIEKDISAIPDGIYILSLRMNEDIFNQKIVIMK